KLYFFWRGPPGRPGYATGTRFALGVLDQQNSLEEPPMPQDHSPHLFDRDKSEPSEEALVPDHRATLTPAQQVERKLVALLKNVPLPLSRLQNGRRRGPY